MYKGIILITGPKFEYYLCFYGKTIKSIRNKVKYWFRKEWKKIAIKYPEISSKKLYTIYKVVEKLPYNLYENAIYSDTYNSQVCNYCIKDCLKFKIFIK